MSNSLPSALRAERDLAAPASAVEAPRRAFLRLVGGGVVLAAAGPLAGCADNLPPEAVAAWSQAGRETDDRRWILAHALLAPHSHNLQSWLVDLRTEGEIVLRCDRTRLLAGHRPAIAADRHEPGHLPRGARPRGARARLPRRRSSPSPKAPSAPNRWTTGPWRASASCATPASPATRCLRRCCSGAPTAAPTTRSARPMPPRGRRWPARCPRGCASASSTPRRPTCWLRTGPLPTRPGPSR
jgi:hypothetical protein